ncbi:hypothetical protein MWU49_04390 [Alcanivorax sp. S6407]|uniref:hypothetical protein n=1 Tax=Alcanivorax sp. S6407 TaxID=2926424 RepID=UPI001FF3BF7D|nr:hypothetical protein [Alcanivorax sp. S6407]MCK0152930.1 hypothetical protein [Alcanivorax sp. S6407]
MSNEAHFTKSDEARIEALIKICKAHQGEYLEPHHGIGSWATTYSENFLNAAAEIVFLYRKSGHPWPLIGFSKLMMGHGIRSCRGKEMNFDRAEYLYNIHLSRRVRALSTNKHSSGVRSPISQS